ncbi:MAG: 30S ribosomal protein S17 [Chloroflexi bacterium]|nr:30S ribosomal protein S17 [Chloroflexota bacterium]
MPDTRKPRRTKTGRVTSNKMDKTVVVAVELVSQHRLYGRTMRRTRHFKAHDPENRCEIGDTVLIAESRPISKDKHWTVQQILRRGTGEPIELVEVPES